MKGREKEMKTIQMNRETIEELKELKDYMEADEEPLFDNEWIRGYTAAVKQMATYIDDRIIELQEEIKSMKEVEKHDDFHVLVNLKSQFDGVVTTHVLHYRTDPVLNMLILEDKDGNIIHYNLDDVLRFGIYPRKE